MITGNLTAPAPAEYDNRQPTWRLLENIDYMGKGAGLAFWRSLSGYEVDFILNTEGKCQ